MRIPFEISKRPQIESGEYKVIYVEYPSTNQYPVEILKWDSNSDAGCIIGCIRRNGKDRIYAFDENGEHKVSGEDDRLFIVTPEPEMNEFEQEVHAFIDERIEAVRGLKEIAAELLSFAKQQLLQSGELMTQEHHEKLMETQYKETLDGVKKNWHDYFTPQAVTDIYNAGRNDVLKDLPRWRKCPGIDYYACVYNCAKREDSLLYYNGHTIRLIDLEKLPGFKEEDHE